MRKLLAFLAFVSLPALAADITTTWTYPTLNTDGSTIPASGAHARGEWYRVPRETVELNARGERLPASAVIVARCG